MAIFNGYYPPTYYQGVNMPYNAPQMPSNAQTQTSNQITWVQGENAAKSFPVGAGQSVLLMDSEESVFYIKSVDTSGMPQPLRIFDYSERKSSNGEPKKTNEATNTEEYVSKAEFNNYKEDMRRLLKKIRGVPAEKAGETNA